MSAEFAVDEIVKNPDAIELGREIAGEAMGRNESVELIVVRRKFAADLKVGVVDWAGLFSGAGDFVKNTSGGRVLLLGEEMEAVAEATGAVNVGAVSGVDPESKSVAETAPFLNKSNRLFLSDDSSFEEQSQFGPGRGDGSETSFPPRTLKSGMRNSSPNDHSTPTDGALSVSQPLFSL